MGCGQDMIGRIRVMSEKIVMVMGHVVGIGREIEVAVH